MFPNALKRKQPKFRWGYTTENLSIVSNNRNCVGVHDGEAFHRFKQPKFRLGTRRGSFLRAAVQPPQPPAPVSLVLLELDPAKLIQLKILQLCPLSGIQIEFIK